MIHTKFPVVSLAQLRTDGSPVGERQKEREKLLAKAKAAEEMAAQFSEDLYLKDSWMRIAEGYRDLAKGLEDTPL